jgi:uncharacterized protein
MPDAAFLLPLLFAVAAFLYASVGHAGASGYLAVMAFFALSSAIMKPSALIMNIVVATIALIQFSRAGYFSWRLLWPFALTSIPMAYVGGWLELSHSAYRVLVGIILFLSALKLGWEGIKGFSASADERAQRDNPSTPRPMPALAPAFIAGAAIGLLAGLTGTGGGIFLSPLLLFMGWGRPRDSAGVAAAFILANSLSGLIGHWPNVETLPAELPWWCCAVAIGGLCGSWIGSRVAPLPVFKLLLATVLVIAAGKLALT